ncbi:hypothetical protein [Dactylosporangium darangshiense]
MVTWARVVLLQHYPRPYERVQAYRILAAENPWAYGPRLAEALARFVDDFSPAAPPEACERLLTEAATALRDWAALRVARGAFSPAELRSDLRINPYALRPWPLLAASIALAAAGRSDAALSVTDEYVHAARRQDFASVKAQLAVILYHRAALLEARSRTPEALRLRAEADEAAAAGATAVGSWRSHRIAELLLASAPPPRTSGRRSLTPPGAAPSRTPMPLR